MLLATGGTWFLIFEGATALYEVPTWMAKATATIYSTALSAGLYAFWFQLHSALVTARSAGTQVRVLLTATLVLPLIVGASATLTVLGQVGHDARARANELAIAALADASRSRYESFTGISGPLVDLKLLAEKFAADHATEQTTGAISGNKGPGAVQAALLSLAQTVERLHSSVEKRLAEGAALYVQIETDLATLRDIAAQDIPNDQKNKLLRLTAEGLSRKLSDLDSRDLSNALVRAAESLPMEIDGLAFRLSANPVVAKNQAEALARLKERVRGASAQLVTIGRKLADMQAGDIPAFRPLSPTQVVIRYAPDYSTVWMGALLIDTGIYWPLVILVVAAGGRSREDEIIEQLSALTVRERVLHGLADRLFGVSTPDAEARALLAKLLGRDGRK
jgi:hypothetical protein